MSIQAGVYSLDGAPIPRGVAEAICRYLTHMRVERPLAFSSPQIALVGGGHDDAPMAVKASQPLISSSSCVLTWDGRLDNRSDVAFDLGIRLTDDLDITVVGAALDHWGLEALTRLIGDWSLARWNPVDGTLTLASDYAGVRPLYFAERADAVHWSTSLAELCDRLALRDDLDERFVLGYLTGLSEANVTPYLGVSAVPAGHSVTWTRDGERSVQRYWSMRHYETPANPRDLAMELRARFAKAVCDRLRGGTPVWAELSGGLDSSAVVCMAHHCLAQSGAAERLRTVSCVSNGSPESDERRFINAVVTPLGLHNEQIVSEDVADTWDPRWGWVSPLHPSGRALAMFRATDRGGGRALLSGRLGDVVMMNTPEDVGAIVEAVQARAFSAAVTLARQWCLRSRRTVWDLAGLLGRDLWPRTTSGRSAAQLLAPFGIDTDDPVQGAMTAYHLSRPMAQHWVAHAERRMRKPALDGVPAAKRPVVADILDSTEQRWLQGSAELSPVTYAHPYADRRLVEFMLRIPARFALLPGQPRALMKAALSDLLPPRVLSRFSKGYGDPLSMRAIRHGVAADRRLVDGWEVVRRGYVDAEHLAESFASIRSGASRRLKNLLMVANLERWLVRREERTRSATG